MADRPEPCPVALDAAVAERDALAQELFESRRFAAQLAIERQHLQDAVDAMQARERDAARAAFLPQLEALRQERDRARGERDSAAAERDRARAEAHDAKAMLHRVTASMAWRMTGPARRLLQALLGR